MGISTTGFVLTEKKDVFAVLETVETALINLIRKYANNQVTFREDTRGFPRIEFNPNLRYVTIYFEINGEGRMLGIHFDCDCDYNEYGKEKIIWSINWWGMAEEIILTVCKAMTRYGKVFYEANDYDGEVVEINLSEKE